MDFMFLFQNLNFVCKAVFMVAIAYVLIWNVLLHFRYGWSFVVNSELESLCSAFFMIALASVADLNCVVAF